jgi:hypothetical protein
MRQEFEVAGRYALFAGNWQNEPNGDRVIGWSQSQQQTGTPPIATEIGPGGNELWAIQAPGWFSYRVFKFEAPDVQAPVVHDVTGVTDGSTLHEGDPAPVADFGCTDTGGSNLTSCTGSVADGQPLPMTPGHHTFTVTAQDGAGNITTGTTSYDVLPAYQPDARIRVGSGPWIGGGVVGGSAQQTVTASIARGTSTRVHLSIGNAGLLPDRVTVCGSPSTKRFSARYVSSGTDVTAHVVACWRTPTLAPGAAARLTLVIHNVNATATQSHRFAIRTSSVHDPTRVDAVAVVARGR